MRQVRPGVRSNLRHRVLAAAALGLIVSAGLAEAQSAGDESEPAEPKAALSALVDLVPLEPKPLTEDLTELCGDKPGGLAWIDRMQAGLYRRMCLTAAGFDGFFGNARFDDEYEATYGSLSVGTLWDERDQLDPTLRFRVNMKLPQFGNRLNGFIGRTDPDEYVTDLRDDFDSLPRQFGQSDDDAVLLGLGYRQPGPAGGHFDAGVGVKLDWPPEAFVKGTYRLDQPFLERNLLRLHETMFWRDGEGFGFTKSTSPTMACASSSVATCSASGCFSSSVPASPGRGRRLPSVVRVTGARASHSKCSSANGTGRKRRTSETRPRGRAIKQCARAPP
jgi:hypothetical protein